MIRETFEEVAAQLNCKYDYSETRSVSLVLRNIPTTYHRIALEYKTVNIELLFEFGSQNHGWVKSSITTDKNLAGFTVETRSQIQRLFSKDKKPFIVKSDDPILESFILNALEESKYNEIALKTTFEPKISGTKESKQFMVKTNFYIGFADNEKAIIPSINLHKIIIDKILR